MADHDGKVKRRATYAVQDLITAVNMIRQKQMGLMQAAREYNVPKSTLQNNLRKNKHGLCIGSPTSLTADEEQDLVDHLIAMQKMGVCLYEDQLKLEVQELMREAKHLDPSHKFRFADDMPGMCVCQKIFSNQCVRKSALPLRKCVTSVPRGKKFISNLGEHCRCTCPCITLLSMYFHHAKNIFHGL